MPFTNNPDRYFLSGGDPAVLLALIQELREQTLALNWRNPGNQNSIFDADTLKRFIQLKTITYNYRMLNAYSIDQADVKIRSSHELSQKVTSEIVERHNAIKEQQNEFIKDANSNTTKISSAIQEYNSDMNQASDDLIEETLKTTGLEKVDFDNTILRDILKSEDSVEKLFAIVSSKTEDQVQKSYNSVNDNYAIPKNESSNRGFGQMHKGNYTGEGVPTDGLDGNAQNFPVIGMDYDNHADDMSNFFTDEATFLSGNPEFYSGSEEDNKMFKSWRIKNNAGEWVPDPVKTFTKKTPFSEAIGSLIKSEFGSGRMKSDPPGSVKFFIEKLHGRYGDGTPYRKGKLVDQGSVLGDIDFSNRMVFAAYIDNAYDTYAPSFSSYSFIGRGEEVPIYKSTKRSFTLSFSIIADYSMDMLAAMEMVYKKLGYDVPNDDKLKELLKDRQNWGMGYIGMPSVSTDGKKVGGHVPGMYSDTPESLWHKLSFLAQACYPYYRADGKMKEQPIVRLRVADFYDVIGYIENYSLDFTEFDNMIDLNPSAIGAVPFNVKVNLSLGIIHDNEPSSNFFGFYNRKEYDTGEADPITGVGLSKTSMSITKDGADKDDSLTFRGRQEDEKLSTMPAFMRDGMEELRKDIRDFQINFQELNNMGIKVQDKVRKQKVEKAMRSFARVSTVADILGERYGINAGQFGDASNVENFNMNDLVNNVRNGNLDESVSRAKNMKDALQNDYVEMKNKVDDIYANAATTVRNVIDKANRVNDTLKRHGVNLVKNDDIENALNKVKGIMPQNIIPKTLGDILNTKK